MSQPPTTNSQFLRTPFLTITFGALVVGMLSLLPHPIVLFGFTGLLGVIATAIVVLCSAVHPLVPFGLYFGSLFFAETVMPGLPLSAGQALGILFLYSFGSFLIRGRAMKVNSGFLPLLVVLSVYFAVRAVTGEDLERGMIHVRYVIIYLVVALTLAASMTTERTILGLCWIIVVLTAAAAVHGLAEAARKDILGGFTGHWGNAVRIKGTARNPIVFGWNMLFPLPFAFYLYSELRSRGTRLLALSLGLLCVFAATFTFNRQTFVLIAILLGLSAVLYRYTNRRFLLLLLGILGAIAAVTVLPLIVIRMSTVTTLSRDISYLERRDSFLMGIEMIKQHPLVGVGLGSFPAVWKRYIPADYSTFYVQYMPETEHRFPDFGYMQVLAEGGIIGECLFVGLLLTWLWRTWRYRKLAVAADDKFATNLSSMAFVLGVFALLSSAIQDTFLYPRLWIALGVVLLVDERILPIRKAELEQLQTAPQLLATS